MKNTILTCMTAMILLVPIASSAQGAATSQKADNRSARYWVFSLDTLGGTSSSANTINDLGWAMGVANLMGNTAGHATLWAYGLKLDLGTFGGINSAVAWPVKRNAGLIAGIAETAILNPLGESWSCSNFFPTSPTFHNCLGFVWQWGVMTPLPTLGGYNGYAAGMNNRGQVAGWAENTVHDPTCVAPQVLQFEPVVYGPGSGKIQQLPTFPGDPDGAATDINDQGQVVGISGTCFVAVGSFSAAHALLWQNGNVTNLGSLGGVAWNTPVAINNRSVVVGFSDLSGDEDGNPNFHAFIWTKSSGMQDLKTLPGDAISEATGINEQGQVVGVSYGVGFSNPRAVLWQKGKIVDLNTLIPAGSGLYLLSANDINDEGVIAGQACVLINGACTSNSETPAFLAVPQGDGWDFSATESMSTQSVNPASSKVVVPENIRRRMLQRHGLDLQAGVATGQ
jgi:probable HAF family extracellular repeat protein